MWYLHYSIHKLENKYFLRKSAKKFKKTIDKYALKAYNSKCKEEVVNTKRADLIKMLERNGWYLKRNGGGHDLYTNGTETETIPRHREIKENLARAIIKRRGLK